MPSKKASKTGKKKPTAKKKALTKGNAVTRADFEMLREQMREVTAVVEKLAETIERLAAAMAGERGAGGGAGASTARGLRATARALGCLDLLTASQIVQEAAGGPHDIDSKLRDIGFISDDQRRIFQEDVFEGVLDEGCEINRGDIPNGADNTLREVRTAIRVAAH